MPVTPFVDEPARVLAKERVIDGEIRVNGVVMAE
jgi:hypothetical protein